MKLNGFDKIALIYDGLAKLVFGKSIVESQKYFLDSIRNRANILILGGGTGWLLKEILKVNSDCKICFVEASSKMIVMAKSKTRNSDRINFIHGTEENIPAIRKYDLVITNFYLDLFTDVLLEETINKIERTLSQDSYWIATDFVFGNKWWQSILLKIMYLFFGWMANIESTRLPDWSKAIVAGGFNEQASHLFYKDFIKSSLYKR